MAQPAEPIHFAASGPTVIMVAGVNGCGKTTSIAKLTKMFLSDGKRVVLGAGRYVPRGGRRAVEHLANVWVQKS